MSSPRVLRCRAAVISRLVVVVVCGWMVSAMIVIFVTDGFSDLLTGTASALYFAAVTFLVTYAAMGLRRRVVIEEDGLELVGAFSRRFVKWWQIRRFEADVDGKSHVLWLVDYRGKRVAVAAFTGLLNNIFYRGVGPPSFREAAAALEDEWQRRRAS